MRVRIHRICGHPFRRCRRFLPKDCRDRAAKGSADDPLAVEPLGRSR